MMKSCLTSVIRQLQTNWNLLHQRTRKVVTGQEADIPQGDPSTVQLVYLRELLV